MRTILILSFVIAIAGCTSDQRQAVCAQGGQGFLGSLLVSYECGAFDKQTAQQQTQ